MVITQGSALGRGPFLFSYVFRTENDCNGKRPWVRVTSSVLTSEERRDGFFRKKDFKREGDGRSDCAAVVYYLFIRMA